MNDTKTVLDEQRCYASGYFGGTAGRNAALERLRAAAGDFALSDSDFDTGGLKRLIRYLMGDTDKVRLGRWMDKVCSEINIFDPKAEITHRDVFHMIFLLDQSEFSDRGFSYLHVYVGSLARALDVRMSSDPSFDVSRVNEDLRNIVDNMAHREAMRLVKRKNRTSLLQTLASYRNMPVNSYLYGCREPVNMVLAYVPERARLFSKEELLRKEPPLAWPLACQCAFCGALDEKWLDDDDVLFSFGFGNYEWKDGSRKHTSTVGILVENGYWDERLSGLHHFADDVPLAYRFVRGARNRMSDAEFSDFMRARGCAMIDGYRFSSGPETYRRIYSEHLDSLGGRDGEIRSEIIGRSRNPYEDWRLRAIEEFGYVPDRLESPWERPFLMSRVSRGESGERLILDRVSSLPEHVSPAGGTWAVEREFAASLAQVLLANKFGPADFMRRVGETIAAGLKQLSGMEPDGDLWDDFFEAVAAVGCDSPSKALSTADFQRYVVDKAAFLRDELFGVCDRIEASL